MDLQAPAYFSLDATVRSSWQLDLSPLRYEAEERRLLLTLPSSTGTGDAMDLEVSSPVDVFGPKGGALGVEGVPLEEQAYVRESLQAMLRLTEDFSLFYLLTDGDPELKFARRRGVGRILRAPTVFEDLLKAVMQGTGSAEMGQVLSERLCTLLGARSASGRYSFPRLSTLAAQPMDFYKNVLQAGRLAEALYSLVQKCHLSFHTDSLRGSPVKWDLDKVRSVSGYLESQVDAELEWSDRVAALLLSLPGVGLRATSRLLPLCGCYDAIIVTPRIRTLWRQQCTDGRGKDQRNLEHAVDRQIHSRVAGYLHYRGLALGVLLASSVAKWEQSAPPMHKNLRGSRQGFLISTC